MRWSTARVAWHDCMFNSRPSVMAVAVENGKLGAAIQTGNKVNDPSVHQAEAGKVQHAISQLPQDLQDVGNWLYAPLTAEDRASHILNVALIVAGAASLTALVPGGKWTQWMPIVIASVYEYARVVLGEDVRRKNGRGIRRWIHDELGSEPREWGHLERRVYERLWDALNELDKQALAPVAQVVNEQIEKQTPHHGRYVG